MRDEYEAKWKLERNVKVKQQEVRNAQISVAHFDKNKSAGKLVGELELLANILSDKFTELGSVENEIEGLEKNMKQLRNQMLAYTA